MNSLGILLVYSRYINMMMKQIYQSCNCFSLFLSFSSALALFHYIFRRWLYSHASIAVAFSDLIIMSMLIAGTHAGSLAGDLAETYFVLLMTTRT